MTDKDFKKELQRVCGLVGQTPSSKETVTTMYEYLKSYDLKDFQSACNDREMLRQLHRERLNVITIEDFIMRHRSIRIEEESRRYKKQEEESVRKILKSEGIPKEVREYIKKLKSECES